MDSETGGLIRHFYELFGAGDFDALEHFVAPDAEFVNPPEAIEGGTHRGREAVLQTGRALHDEFEYKSVEIEELTEGPDGILVLVRFGLRGRGSGVPMDERFTHVLQVRDGLITRLAWFSAREDGARAAGL